MIVIKTIILNIKKETKNRKSEKERERKRERERERERDYNDPESLLVVDKWLNAAFLDGLRLRGSNLFDKVRERSFCNVSDNKVN